MSQFKPLIPRTFTRRTMPSWKAGACGLVACCCVLLLTSPLWAGEQQQATPEEQQASDPWAPFRFLVGTWEGAIDGRLGQGTGRRHYEFILDGQFLLSRHSSIRLPQKQSPEGDHHRELAVFSFDSERCTIVYRQFLVEGVVNRYTCEVEPKKFVCTTEAVEGASGARARETVVIVDPFHFEETFELSFSPDKELQVYFTNRWTKTPRLNDF